MKSNNSTYFSNKKNELRNLHHILGELSIDIFFLLNNDRFSSIETFNSIETEKFLDKMSNVFIDISKFLSNTDLSKKIYDKILADFDFPEVAKNET
jgi:hypothetical protein